MCEFLLSYREIIPDQTVPESWKEIVLNTGGAQSTLQDIKVAERASGYCYRNATKHHTRNRFIYWRISHDVLELVEQSLDLNLTGSRVRYKFTDTPILDGITIHETYSNVVILVPTVCSVHRLIFPHPDRIHRQDELLGSHPDLAVPSIFTDASPASARDPSTFHIVNNPSTVNSVLPHAAASLLTIDEDAFFALAYPSGELLVLRQIASGQVTVTELKQETIMPRLFTVVTSAFRNKAFDGNVVVSILLHSMGLETYAFTFCRDGNLRIWSCTKGQCIGISNILSETTNTSNSLIQGAQTHLLRKYENNFEFYLVVFLSFSTNCQFHILKPILNNNVGRILRIDAIYAKPRDLIDFSVANGRIWTLWREEDGECSVYSAIINGTNGESSSDWMPAILEPIPDAEQIPSDFDVDPREAYLQYIFHPGRFPLSVISKALSIYRRSTVLTDINVSAAVLKQRVCLAVEAEIQSELKECEVGDDEYLECANWCWSKFYSCCVQYHVAGLRPLGLLQLPSVSSVVFLKKSMYSFLRPLDPLEHMMLCHDYCKVDQFNYHSRLSQDRTICEDLIKLIDVLVSLEQQVSDKYKYDFSKNLSLLKSPDVIVVDMIRNVVADIDENFMQRLLQQVSEFSDFYQALHLLLELLHIENDIDEDRSAASAGNKALFVSVSHLFNSQLGISVVSQCLYQQAVVRFTICRNLLLIVNILLMNVEQQWTFLEAVRMACLPEIVILTRACYALLWVCEISALPTLPIESNMQRLASLKLAPVFHIKSNTGQSTTLLELFAVSTGGSCAHKVLAKTDIDEESLANWHSSLLPLVNLLGYHVWLMSNNMVLGEWLLASGQHVWLQQYVRLLKSGCDWKSHSGEFLLAVSLLCNGEHLKAEDLFVRVAKGVYTDQYLASKILAPEANNDQPLVNYYLKVIQLFELHGARRCAINIAKLALNIVEPDSSYVSMLYSIQFLHHLALGHYDQAYISLNANPDHMAQKDNLRNLVKTLLDRKELDTLMSFPYAGMESDFIKILYTRARATDSVYNVYYDFLYSYQVKRGAGSFREAAGAMYEQAFCLSQHTTVEALEKQVKCYLACINALNLVESKYAWVVKPSHPDVEEVEISLSVPIGSDEEPKTFKLKDQMEVVELSDIQKEMTLASARLRLARFEPKSLTNQLRTPNELVAVLVSVGMFKNAITISQLFKLHLSPIFEALTRKCVLLTRHDKNNAWNWLIHNDLNDMPVVESSPATVAWRLLETFLMQQEKPRMSELHKIVCQKIISMGSFIPNWLMKSYKKRNASELLRLLYSGGRLRDATELAVDFLKAAMGHGKEHFGLDSALMPTGPPLCLPINSINVLLWELEAQNNIDTEKNKFEQEHKILSKIFNKYLETSARISSEMFHTRRVSVK